MKGVVDFRARPNTPEWARYLARRNALIHQQSGTAYSGYQAREETLEEFVEQLDRAGIETAVFAARNRTASEQGWTLTNDFVAECAASFPSRIVGYAGVDAGDPPSAAAEAQRAVEKLGLRGVCFDPFALQTSADDERLDPIYNACSRLGVPVVVTLGGWPGIAAPLRDANPLAVDVVARRFPDLTIVASHAGWPFVNEMIAVAWRCENVFFENSFYHRAPGADLIVEAANSMIGDKILYASAYPFTPLAETLESFRTLPFDESVIEKVLGGNARALLERTRPVHLREPGR